MPWDSNNGKTRHTLLHFSISASPTVLTVSTYFIFYLPRRMAEKFKNKTKQKPNHTVTI